MSETDEEAPSNSGAETVSVAIKEAPTPALDLQRKRVAELKSQLVAEAAMDTEFREREGLPPREYRNAVVLAAIGGLEADVRRREEERERNISYSILPEGYCVRGELPQDVVGARATFAAAFESANPPRLAAGPNPGSYESGAISADQVEVSLPKSIRQALAKGRALDAAYSEALKAHAAFHGGRTHQGTSHSAVHAALGLDPTLGDVAHAHRANGVVIPLAQPPRELSDRERIAALEMKLGKLVDSAHA